ncbi:MAG: hypothetical protein Q8R82_12970 [Hyphomonadaceae bacterium]|nr:hypothetical protein [Hyphomonadaceae bacterium]
MAVALGLAFASAGAAGAQDLSEAQTQEVHCVHNALVARRATSLVAQSYLSETTVNGFRGRADGALEAAATGCAQLYEWDDMVRGLGVAIGTMGATGDFLGVQLKAAGVAEATIEKIAGLKPGLSQRDKELLMDGGWGDDRAFMARMRTKLLAAGAPDDEAIILNAVKILETEVIGADFIASFVEVQFS